MPAARLACSTSDTAPHPFPSPRGLIVPSSTILTGRGDPDWGAFSERRGAEVRILVFMSTDRLYQRLREMKARAAIQAWEARQVSHAGGVWFRFQLLLAHTRRAFVISTEEVSILRASGFEADPIGAELEPPKSLFVVQEAELRPSITGREVALQDGPQIVAAPALLLIPFR